jgi:phytoene/squalene synthetase
MTTQAERHLAEADRHIAEAKARIAHQEELIAQLAAAGQDTAFSRKLLKVLKQSLALTRQHRALILAEIAGTLSLLC